MRGLPYHPLVYTRRLADDRAATRRWAVALLVLTACAGCAAPGRNAASCSTPAITVPISPAATATSAVTAPENPQPAASIRQVAYHEPLPELSELSLAELTAEVEARNPSVQAMVAAWQAASERYPQVVSLDDPMFGFMLGARAGQRRRMDGHGRPENPLVRQTGAPG